MLQLINNTSFQAERTFVVNHEGNQIWTVLVKATYQVHQNGFLEPHPEPEPVHLTSIYLGEPGRSTLLRESEAVASHPGTDITLAANAYAPQGYPVQQLAVRATVGPISKTLQVTGDRFWEQGVLGPRMTTPQPFVCMPISYERAYGGTNLLPGGEEKEPRNPIGQGFASVPEALIGRPVPNIEEYGQEMQTWKDRPRPVGLCPIPPMWTPRLEYAGTYDAQWKTDRMPLLPLDYDERHTLSAHPDLISPQPLRGGEMVELINLTPNSLLRFQLPHPYLAFMTKTKRGMIRHGSQLDRVILEPDANKLVMVWRSSLNCGSRVRDVISTTIEEKRRIER